MSAVHYHISSVKKKEKKKKLIDQEPKLYNCSRAKRGKNVKKKLKRLDWVEGLKLEWYTLKNITVVPVSNIIIFTIQNQACLVLFQD